MSARPAFVVLPQGVPGTVMITTRAAAAELAAGLVRNAEHRRRQGFKQPAEFEAMRVALVEFATAGSSDGVPDLLPPSSAPPESWVMGSTEAADRLECTPSRVRQLLRAGRLRGEPDGDGVWCIDPTSVDERLAARS